MASLRGILRDKQVLHLWISLLRQEDLAAVPLPVRKRKLVIFRQSFNCCSFVLIVDAELQWAWILTAVISVFSLSILYGFCLCVHVSPFLISLLLWVFLEVFMSFVYICVCACSWVRWQFQGWVYGAYPLSWVSLSLRQQPEVHLDNWGQLWQHCQVTQLANNIIIHAYLCTYCIFGINEKLFAVIFI